MSIHYRYPILLIEFDKEYAFTLQSFGEARVPRQVRQTDQDIQSKLVLLTLAFPRLRIIWSSSPYSTADIFAELKHDFDEPDAATAASIGQEHGELAEAYNYLPVDMLRTMPAVTTKNYVHICNKVRNMHELCHLSLADIQQLIGSEPGRKLHTFLHK